MKYIYALVLFVSLALPSVLKAQYETIRNPLTAEEKALYRKNKVMAEIQKVMDNGVAKNYRARAFDSSGRLLASIMYDHSQYYLYDNKGNVVAYLDSVRGTGDKFIANEYSFTYDEKTGKLTHVTLPTGEMDFTFDAKHNILTQSYMTGDSLKLSKYYFDAANRLLAIEGYDHANKLANKVQRAFSVSGNLVREEIVSSSTSGTDSNIVVYLYNANKQLVKKQVFSFRKFLFSTAGTKEPTHAAEQNSVSTFVYTYDKKGNKLTEDYTNNKDKFSNYYATWQYNEKGLITKRTIKKAVGEPETILYEYGYFE